ncbi:unnamed protein product [Lathyrus oleraceus]
MKPSSPRVGNSSARNDGDAHALLLNLWLASPQVLNLTGGNKVDDNLVQRLKNTLYAVEAVFNDAEHKQIKWLDDLKDAFFVADDILDQISVRIRK